MGATLRIGGYSSRDLVDGVTFEEIWNKSSNCQREKERGLEIIMIDEC